MAQVIFSEKVGALSYSSPNVSMAASVSSPAILNIGGQQYTVTSSLSVNTGTLTLQNLYYVYAVQTAGVVSIVVSTRVNSLGPVGFTSWKMIGAFYTDTLAAFSSFVSNKAQTAPTFVPILSSQTYTTPPQLIALKLKAVGGGAGGGGSGANGWSNGSTPGSTSFGSVLSCPGGIIAAWTNAATSGSTAASSSAPFVMTINANGPSTAASSRSGVSNSERGADGAASPFGGQGRGGSSGDITSSVGGSAVANSGSGGGGGGSSIQGVPIYPGSGGGAGSYAEGVIYAPNLIASYTCVIGTAGSSGTPAGAGGNNGGSGGTGVIYLEEIKPNLEQLKDL